MGTLLIVFVGVALLLLTVLAAWSPRVGLVLAFGCRNAATWCKHSCAKCLGKSSHVGSEPTDTNDEYHLIGVAIFRLMILAISLIIVLGAFPLDWLRSAALNHLVVHFLPLPFDVFIGMLWLLVPGVYALLVAEVTGILPSWMHLWPALQAKKKTKVVLAAACSLAFVIALIDTFYLHVFGQCQVLGLACGDDATLQIYINSTFGLLQAAAEIISLIGIILGLSALAGIGLWAVYCMFSLGQLLFGLVGTRKPLKKSNQPFYVSPFAPPLVRSISMDMPIPLALPEPVSDAQETKKQQEDEQMRDQMRVNSFVTFEGDDAESGSFGYRTLLRLLNATAKVGASGSVVASGIVSTNIRPHLGGTLMLPKGVENVSPTLHEIEQAYAHYDTTSKANKSLADLMVSRMVQSYGTLRANGTIMIPFDILTIHDVEDALLKMKQRLPKHRRVLMTTWPEEDHRRGERFVAAVNKLIELQKEQVIETTFLFDVHSPLALEEGEERQEELGALDVCSLYFCHLNDPHNLTPSQILARLGKLSPFIGQGMASVRVSPGKLARGWWIVKKAAPQVGDRGYGDVNDALRVSKELTRRVIEDEETHAIATPLDVSVPFIMLYIVPIRPEMDEFHEYSNQMRAFLGREYRMGQAIVVPGNGTIDPKLGDGYYCQVAVLFPVAPSHFTTASQQRPTLVAKAGQVYDAQTDAADTKQNGRTRSSEITL